jgi:diguanylate cyclase (GGDEF)-like protein
MSQAKRRKGYSFAVLFLDLDYFKIVNDTRGHRIGDQLLAGVASRIGGCQRPGDTVARLGGDEFAILLHDVGDGAVAIRVAERIQQELMLPFNLKKAEIVTTASIGIALSATGYDEPEDVLHDADKAMYLAKSNGRSRHELFDRGLQARAKALAQSELDLRQAVERQEFLIYYQPIVSLASGRITGTEALLRWQHPRRGLVPPKEFLPLAVRTRLIVPIEEWVLRTACAQNKAWQEAGSPSLHVDINLSVSHLKDKRLPDLVARVLLETGMAAATLGVEIPEFVARKNLDLAMRALNELSALGTQILLDDFGAADSSLGSLKRFPVKTLKIDRSLVAGVATVPADAAITTAIIAMAHSLNMGVIAEGMETQDQLAFLRSRQCDAIQGNIFSQPLPVEGMTKLLRKAQSSGASASSMSE